MRQYANPEALVDTAWVNAHRDDASLRLVEVDVDRSAYEEGHVFLTREVNNLSPGARLARGKGDAREAAERKALTKAERMLSRTRVITAD